MQIILAILLLSPLVGSLLNGLIIRSPSARLSGTIATVAALVSFLCAIVLTSSVMSGNIVEMSWLWFGAGSFKANWGFRFDQLTSVMALVVTGIGTLIHLYSVGYMSHEKSPFRYFAYLNLFLFQMSVLITSSNLVGLFVGWEGVGLCSYLLIGYWFEDPEKAKAGLKAFLVNRVGDAGFLVGMFICYQLFETLEFQAINSLIDTKTGFNLHLLNLMAFFLFVGATGKSAQVPLYVWLPDAMAGPTPVSALIHAATMVTSGIYLIVRLNPLFVVTLDTNLIIASVGLGTAVLAGLIATSQNDIKKVLAYSTVSQLGLMFLALGCRAYVAAIFHLVTHAFFKALLFLGAGSVIHALEGEQDILRMGGLRKKLPITFWTFAVATCAIAGIPPLAGFFSKDTILHFALMTNFSLWVGGAVVATLTAFYMFRMFSLTFLGTYRGTVHPHESPAVMWVPLAILAVASAVGGFLGVPHEFHFLPNYLEDFLSPVVPSYSFEGTSSLGAFEAMGITTGLALVSSALAVFLFSKAQRAGGVGKGFSPLRFVFSNKFWVDELYGIIIVKPFRLISQFLSSIFDPQIIDGGILFLAKAVRGMGGLVTLFQTGVVQFYLFLMLIGTVLIFWWFLKGWVI